MHPPFSIAGIDLDPTSRIANNGELLPLLARATILARAVGSALMLTRVP
jgi:hypothetical protein